MIDARSFSHGSVTDEDWACLCRSLEAVYRLHGGDELGVVLEVGTLSGKTTRGILDVLEALSWEVAVHTLDKDPRAEFPWREYCGRHYVGSWFHAMTAPEFLRDCGLRILWAFVDGCHCEECVAKDIAAIAPRVPIGGHICFHDADRQAKLGMLVHRRYHGDGVARLYGVTTAIEKSPLMADFELYDRAPARVREPGAPTPIFGGVRCYERRR